MKNVMQFALIGALAAGIAFAQAPTPHSTARNMARQHMANIAQKLNLTDAQQKEFHAIFDQARQDAMPVRQELRANREAMAAAVKADRTAEIQQLATARGKLVGQMTAIHAQARAKFYQTLTPEQRVKADQMHNEFRQQMRDRWNQTGDE